jgi:hypothetical protein
VDSYIADLEMTTAPKERNEQTRINNSSRWIPPPPGIAKINVDAAISKNGGIGSMAAVARDSTGTFLGASALVVEGISDPEMMEAIASREGGALATDLFLQKVKMASDYNNVVKSFREEALGPYYHVIRDLRAMQGDFQHFELVHENRRTNLDAHGLARSSLYTSLGRYVWFLQPPDGFCISHTSADL